MQIKRSAIRIGVGCTVDRHPTPPLYRTTLRVAGSRRPSPSRGG
jgi:hypothetical protein